MEIITAPTFKIKEIPKRHFAYIRNVGPYQGNTQLFERLFKKVVTYLVPNKLLQNESECISIYHDDPEAVPVEKQRISVGFTVPEGSPGKGDVEIMEIPAGKFFIGSFEIYPSGYGEAWGELMEELSKEGLRMGNIAYESYKNDPKDHPEGKHIVDICVSVF